MNRNLVGSIYGRSSIKMLISSWSVNKYGHHRQFLFLIGWFLKIFSSVTASPNDQKQSRTYLWKVFYKDCSFRFYPLSNMAATGNSCFWLVRFLKNLFLRNRFPKWTETWWESSMEVSSKQNERWATQAQPTEPEVLIARSGKFSHMSSTSRYDIHLFFLHFGIFLSHIKDT